MGPSPEEGSEALEGDWSNASPHRGDQEVDARGWKRASNGWYARVPNRPFAARATWAGMHLEGRGPDAWDVRIALGGNENRFERSCEEPDACTTLRNVAGPVSDSWRLEPSRIHHTWTLEAGSGRVTSDIEVDGADRIRLESKTSAILQVGERYLTYGGLAAFDANGRQVPASFDFDGDRLQVHVETTGASFPVTVDPTITSYDWQVESTTDGAGMGELVRFVGDVNGDDWDDLAVGSPGYSNGESEEGRLDVYYGSASGLPATPSWSFEPDIPNARFGTSVDIGAYRSPTSLTSIFVGAPGAGPNGEGAVYRFDGSVNGLSTSPDGVVSGTQAGEGFGAALAVGSDTNGAYFRIIVGAPYFSNGEQDEGRVVDASEMMRDPTVTTPADTFESDVAGAELGYAISSPLLSSPHEFVVVGAPGYSGTASEQGRLYELDTEYLSVSSTWGPVGANAGSRLGESLTFVRLMIADGAPVMVAGEPGYSGQFANQGRVQFFKRGQYGDFHLEAAAFDTREGSGPGAALGATVCPASDLNGDARGDVLVGAPGWSDGQAGEGRAQVYLGSATGVQSQPYWSIDGQTAGAALGTSGCSAGDVDGDGFQDLAIGAPGWDGGGTDRGKVVLYRGGAALPGDTYDWTTSVSATETYFGENLSYAGDVNGDGYDDFVVGESEFGSPEESEGRVVAFYGSATGPGLAPSWTYEPNTPYLRIGRSLDGGGDINGDGYSDVVVGMSFYENGESKEGRVTVFFGSDTGLESSPGWSYEPNLVDERLGYNVEQVGDVNGDGYTDFLVASGPISISPNQAGRVYLFFGSRHGVEDEPAATYTGVETFQKLGSSLGRAGDINGDGFADFLLASDGDEKVYVYHGTGSGAPTQEAVVLSSTIGWRFGASAGTAGDVNGDGFSDIIISEWRYSSPTTINVGRVYLYYGSPAGVSQPADWIVTGDGGKKIGDDVGLAGDINADGYSDFFVSSRGLYVDVYLGGPSGPGSSPDWGAPDISGIPLKSDFVDTVGDVNGDGYDDFVLGAPTSQAGALYGFYGNRGVGTSPDFLMRDVLENARHQRVLRPWAKSSDSPSSSLYLWLWADDGFGLADPARAQLETKPLGTAFDGTNFENGLHYGTTFQHSVLDASNAPLGPYHLRMRWDYAPFVRSPVQRSRWLHGGYPGEARGTHLRGFHNVAPEGEPRSWSILEDSVLSATLPNYDRDANPVTVSLPTAPTNGQVALIDPSSGQFEYTPNANFNGSDHFSYLVSDGQATGGPYDVDVTVEPVNDLPSFVTTPVTSVPEDQLYTYAIEAVDVDVNQTLAVSSTLLPGWLSLQDHGDGTATLSGTPGQIQVGTDRVELEVRDGEGGVATQEFYVEVVEVNDRPTAFGASVSTLEDTPVEVPFVGQDVESTMLTYAVSQRPSHGTISSTSGRWIYTPNPDYNGPDSIAYTAFDGEDTSTPTVIDLTVEPVNDPPRFVPPTPADETVFTVSEGSMVLFDVVAEDPDADTLTLDVSPEPGPSTFDATNGVFEWDVTWEHLGEHDLTLSVSDGTMTVQREVTVDVQIIDEDEDGVSDPWERLHGLDPTDPDSDDDGIMDGHEVGGRDPQPYDTDGDGTIDALDTDSDGDGVLDRNEAGDKILETPPIDSDRDGMPDFRDSDSDGDGASDGEDNCPTVRNPEQRDRDEDDLGDLCDEDADGDDVNDDVDNCVGIRNPDQANADGDDFGDRCDADADGDGVDDAEDTCPFAPNSDQSDSDGDGMGDVCDPDDDQDRVLDESDGCPQEVGEGVDGCPSSGGEQSTDGQDTASDGCGCGSTAAHPVGDLIPLLFVGSLVVVARRRRRRG